MNFLTELREGLAISWSAIRANKLRSVLTTLGIVIGIVTVTLMGTAIEGINHAFMNSISSIGADVLYVDRSGWFIQSRQEWLETMKRPAISLAEVDALQRQMTLAGAIAPVASDNASVKFNKRGSTSIPVIGTTEQYQMTSGLNVESGRFLSAAECDGGRPVCVIGSDLATNLFPQESPVGQKITVANHAYEVVGVLEKQGGFGESGGADSEVIMPLAQFTYAIWQNPDYEIQVKAKNLGQLDDMQEELRAVMRHARHLAPGDPDNFAINQQDQFLEMFHSVAGTHRRHRPVHHRPVAFRRRHRHHEHHVRLRRGADARNRRAQGHRRQTPDHPAAISDRSRVHLPDRRRHRAAHRVAGDAAPAKSHAGNAVAHCRGLRAVCLGADRRVRRLFPRLARGAHEPRGCPAK